MSGGDGDRIPAPVLLQQRQRRLESNNMEKSMTKVANQKQHNVVQRSSSALNSNSSASLGMLAVCAAGICTCYLWYGVMQERMHVLYPVPMTAFFVLSQCCTNVIVAKIYSLFVSSPPTNDKRKLFHSLFLLAAFCYFGAMTASNHGLHYVSYPVVVLIKSSKLIPTMVVGFLVERKRYSRNEWMGAACITFGIIIFHLSQHWSTNANDDDNNSNSDEENKVSSSSSLFGLALLVGSLAMDGLLGSCQGLLKKERSQYRRPDAMETMMYLNLYAIVFLLPTALYTGHWKNGMDLILLDLKQQQQPENDEHSEFISSLLLINGTAAVGQIFVFFTIHLYSPLMCTTITTTRKFITVLLSVYRFGHVFSTTQWSCVALVFGGVYMEIISKVSSPKKTKLH